MQETPQNLLSWILTSWRNWLEKKYGHHEATLIITRAFFLGIVALMAVGAIGVVVCVGIVTDAAFHISSNLGYLTAIFSSIVLLISFYILMRHKRLLFLDSRLSIPILAFIQTFFWVIDSQNSIHEPRSVFLLAIVAGFIYSESKVGDIAEFITPYIKDFADYLTSIRGETEVSSPTQNLQ